MFYDRICVQGFDMLLRDALLSVGKFERKDVRNRILEKTLWHCGVKKEKEKREESEKEKESGL